MIDKIYITRHGFRSLWTLGYNARSETGIPKDEALTEYGEAQSLELANYLSALPLNERPTAIFSSPYYRCLQTARPISKALNIPVYVEHGLSEWRSELLRTGLHHPHLPASTLKGYFPEIDDTWAPVWLPSRNGENIELLHDRMAGFTETFIPEVERRLPEEKHARILLISHAAPIIGLARHLLGDRELPLRPGCCSLTEAVPKKDGGWTATALGDGTHLSEAMSDWRQWGFEDYVKGYGKDHPDMSEIVVDETAGSQLGRS